MRTVFFGPFVGEFGWEISWWQGWVKKMCREKYKGWTKIISSYKGREILYPDATLFWGHQLTGTTRGYGDNANVEDLFSYYKNNLPKDTIFYVPWKLNRYDNKFIGVINSKICKIPKTISPPKEDQIFERLTSEINVGKERMIALFPRYMNKRLDRIWSKENWDELIQWLKKEYPSWLIGIFGTTNGCWYKKAPQSCIDVINKSLDEQIVYLQKCDLAIGSESGAMRFVDLTGCPNIEFGLPENEKRVKIENVLNTEKIYYPKINPSVVEIETIVRLFLNGRKDLIKYPKVKMKPWWRDGFYRKNLLNLILREMILRPKLWLLKYFKK